MHIGSSGVSGISVGGCDRAKILRARPCTGSHTHVLLHVLWKQLINNRTVSIIKKISTLPLPTTIDRVYYHIAISLSLQVCHSVCVEEMCDCTAAVFILRPLKDLSAQQLVTGRVHNNYTITKNICIIIIIVVYLAIGPLFLCW